MDSSPIIDFFQLDTEFGCYGVNTPGAIEEMRGIHRETFLEDTYRRNGVMFSTQAVVLDVGANVGLFSLALKRDCPDARIYAFEPAPASVQALRANLELHCAENVFVQAMALGDIDRPAVAFAFFCNMPGNSTLFPERKAFDQDHVAASWGDGVRDDLYARDIVEVPIARLSSWLRQRPEIDQIDLLKIDVEGAETEVLRGIDEVDWLRIRQIVIEVQDLEGILEAISLKLEGLGFAVTVETPAIFAHLRYRIVYGVRA